jgi:hypothetical protein
MPPLTIVPVILEEYTYCCVFPCSPSETWPSLPAEARTGILLEAEGGQESSSLNSLSTYEQEWPRDVVRSASSVGREVSLSLSGIPLVDDAILSDRVGSYWHRLTLGVVTPDRFRDERAAWEQLHERIQVSLIPERWLAPRDCRAILHVEEGEYVYLLTPERERLSRWLQRLIVSRFPSVGLGLAEGGAHGEMLTNWILTQGNRTGLRLAEVNRVTRPSGTSFRLIGRWGQDPAGALSVGDAGGAPFDCEVGPNGSI